MERRVIYYSDELYHYGVPGQKWGVRNYQNEDGSYKPGAEGRYYDPVGTARFGKNGGLSAQSRHGIAKRRNEQKFKDASTGKKIIRTAAAVATLGLGKASSRFQYRHQVGINKLNKAAGVLGGLSVVGGAIMTATGNPLGIALINSGASTVGSAVVNRYINMPLNDLMYENLYSGHKKNIYRERENALNYESGKKEAKSRKDDALADINDKYNKQFAQAKNNYKGAELRAKNEEITNHLMADINKVNSNYDKEVKELEKNKYSNF